METTVARSLVGRVLHALGSMELSDGELLQRYAAGGDEAAFAEVVRRHGPLVLRVCRQVLGEAAAAEDAFQATFLLLARRARQLTSTGSVAGWLHTVALRTARDARRAEARRRRREQAHGVPSASAADDRTWGEVRAQLDTELAALPEKYRLPLILCYLQELTYETAAQRLGCSVGALRGRLERGKELLRTRLARYGLALAAPLLLLGRPSAVSATLSAATLTTVRCDLAGGVVAPAVARLVGSSLRLKIVLVASIAAMITTIGVIFAVGKGQAEGPPKSSAKPSVVLADSNTTDEARPRTDALGDPLPPGAVMRLGTSRFRHSGGQIHSLAYSADGRRIVTGNAGTTRLLDSASVVVWDAETGQPLRRWSGHAHVVRSVAISPDNRRVAVANGYGKVVLYDVASGKELRCFDTQSSETVLFTPDSSTLLVCDKNAVRRWDLAANKELEPLSGHEDRIFSLASAADGKTLATCACDGTVRLWNGAGHELRRFRIPQKYGLGVALSRDGSRLACGTFEHEIYVWDTASGRELWHIQTEDGRVATVSFSPDGATLATGGDDKLRLWDATTGKSLRVVDCPRGAAHNVVAFSPDGKRIATAGLQATIQFWDPATGKELLHQEGHQHGVREGVFAPDGTTLATASEEPFVHLWDLSTGKARRFAVEEGNVYSLAFAPDGKSLALSGSRNAWPALWDLATGKLLRRFEAKEQEPPGGRVVLSADGKTLLASTGHAHLRLWDTATGQELPQQFEGSIDPASSSFTHFVQFVLAPDGKTVATTRDQSSHSGIVLWDMTTGKERGQVAAKGMPAAFTPDGRLLAVLDGPDVRLLDMVRGVEVRRVQGDARRATCAAFSPDGKTLATAGEEGVVYLWETATGRRRQRLTGHQDTINFLAFAPDGRRLASGGEDLTVLLWDLAEAAVGQHVPRP